MGTSTAFEGQGGHTPLIPSWLDEPDQATADAESAAAGEPPGQDPDSSDRPPGSGLPPIGDPNRFTAARSNFTRFARSGGRDRASLGRAISRYVNSSAGALIRPPLEWDRREPALDGLLAFLQTRRDAALWRHYGH